MVWSIAFFLCSLIVGAVLGSIFPMNLLEAWDSINGIHRSDHPLRFFDVFFAGLFIGPAIATLMAGGCIFKDREYRQKIDPPDEAMRLALRLIHQYRFARSVLMVICLFCAIAAIHPNHRDFLISLGGWIGIVLLTIAYARRRLAHWQPIIGFQRWDRIPNVPREIDPW